MEQIFKRFSEKGYKHYTENTIEELDKLCLDSPDIITEFAHLVEWLRINHSIHVEVSCDVYGELWFVKLEVCSKEVWDDLDKRHKILTAHRKFNNEHKSKQEAYSAAFDYILNNLI
jgi:predicted DNA-binding protein (UPF0278 family)